MIRGKKERRMIWNLYPGYVSGYGSFNFTAEDGYAAARISIAEMLLTGTTCFLESMVCQLALPFSFLLMLS
jgi:hypothetical protein